MASEIWLTITLAIKELKDGEETRFTQIREVEKGLKLQERDLTDNERKMPEM